MIDFTQHLVDYEGKTITYSDENVPVKKGEDPIEIPVTLRRVAYFSLLDLAKAIDIGHELNSAKTKLERLAFMRKIDADPKSVNATDREKEILFELVAMRFDVVCTGQVVELIS